MSFTYVQRSLRRRGDQRGWLTALSAALLVLLVTLLTICWGSAPANAAERGTVFQAGNNVTIPREDTAESVVAIGGNVTVAGTVRTSIIAVGGDVRLNRTAVVGSSVQQADTSIVLVGGSLDQAQGARVTGQVSNVTGSWAGDIWNQGITDQVTRPYSGFSLIAWLGGTVLALLLAVLIAALVPRQVTAVRDRVRRSFWSSLGWGALGLIILVPLVTVLLVITVIGLLAVPPWLLVVVSALVLGAVAVAAALGGWALSVAGYKRENLILTALVGVVILRLLALLPLAGGIITAIAWMVGFGATAVALWSWQRRRHDAGQHSEEAQAPDMRAA